MGAGGEGVVKFAPDGCLPDNQNDTANGIVTGLANGSRVSDTKYPTMELPLDAADNLALHEPITAIDKRDAATPDSWIPRHPSLIRLTGR